MIDPQWRSARRILLVRLDNLGDVLLATPAFHAVRESVPEAELTLLASPVGAQVGELNSDIDHVITCTAPWVDPWMEIPFDPSREEQMLSTLKEFAFDAAIIFTSFRQSSLPAAYLCYLAGIPLRLGASIDASGSLLTTRHRHPEHLIHEVERGLDLVGAVGFRTERDDLVLPVPEHSYAPVRNLIGTSDSMPSGPLVVIHPGCSMPARTYPWEMYAEVGDLLIERLSATVVLTGTQSECDLVGQIQRRMRYRCISAAGRFSFAELCALIDSADLTVTNNTGPMHVSAAVKTPVVALFALTNPPEQWGPWRVPHRLLFVDVPCRICYQRSCPYGHECLRHVSPERVLRAARELLTGDPSATAIAASGQSERG